MMILHETTWSTLAEQHPGLLDLEAAALVGFRADVPWGKFSDEVLATIDALPLHVGERRTVVCHSLHCLTTGDPNGQHPPGDAWGTDPPIVGSNC